MVGDSLKPAPSDPNFRAMVSLEDAQRVYMSLEQDRMEKAMRDYEEKRRTMQEPVPPRNPVTMAKLSDDLKRAYERSTKKLSDAYNRMPSGLIDEVDAPKWQSTPIPKESIFKGGVDFAMDAVVFNRKGMAVYSNLTEDGGYEANQSSPTLRTMPIGKPPKREVPVAPTGGRRKIRLED